MPAISLDPLEKSKYHRRKRFSFLSASYVLRTVVSPPFLLNLKSLFGIHWSEVSTEIRAVFSDLVSFVNAGQLRKEGTKDDWTGPLALAVAVDCHVHGRQVFPDRSPLLGVVYRLFSQFSAFLQLWEIEGNCSDAPSLVKERILSDLCLIIVTSHVDAERKIFVDHHLLSIATSLSQRWRTWPSLEETETSSNETLEMGCRTKDVRRNYSIQESSPKKPKSRETDSR